MKRFLSLLLSGATTLSLLALAATPAAAASDKLSAPETAKIIATKEKISVKSGSASSDKFNDKVGKLFDGDYNQKFEGGLNNNTVTVTWQTDSAVAAAYYVLYSGNDTANYGGGERNPTSWKLYGSTDGSSYTLLDSVENPDMKATNFSGHGYKIDNPTSYSYYKIELTHAKNTYFQVGEMELFTDADVKGKSDSGLTAGRYELPCTSFSGGTGCGFIDGNLYTAVGFSELLGTGGTNETLPKVQLYINGNPAKLNSTYMGYTHCGLNNGDGLFYGLVSGGYTASSSNELVVLIGDEYFTKTTFSPENDAIAVLNSDTTYYQDINKCISVVTFATAQSYTVGNKIESRIHDEHDNKLEFEVTAVDGNTVTFECSSFTTTHSLLEMNQANAARFSVPIDHLCKTQGSIGYVQTRANKDNFDLRVVVEANKNLLKSYDKVVIDTTFTLADGTTRTFTSGEINKAWTSVSAAGKTYTASSECGLYGTVITGIPYLAAAKVSAKVTYSGTNAETSVVELGEANLLNASAVRATLTKYDASKITVPNNGQRPGDKDINDNEGAYRLFDGTNKKFGTGEGNFSVEFTTDDSICINAMIFVAANDSFSDKRTYASWTLYGKDASGNWIEIGKSDRAVTYGTEKYDDNKITDPDSRDDDNTTAYLLSGNTASYSEYKLDIVGAGGVISGADGYNQMAEVVLYTAKN